MVDVQFPTEESAEDGFLAEDLGDPLSPLPLDEGRGIVVEGRAGGRRGVGGVVDGEGTAFPIGAASNSVGVDSGSNADGSGGRGGGAGGSEFVERQEGAIGRAGGLPSGLVEEGGGREGLGMAMNAEELLSLPNPSPSLPNPSPSLPNPSPSLPIVSSNYGAQTTTAPLSSQQPPTLLPPSSPPPLLIADDFPPSSAPSGADGNGRGGEGWS